MVDATHFRISIGRESYDRWQPVLRGQAKPTESMTALILATRHAVEAGNSYTADVLAFVLNEMAGRLDGDPEEGKDRVEGGEVGMDVYYARQAVEAEDGSARIKELGLDRGSHCAKLVSGGQLWGGTTEYRNVTITNIRNGNVIGTGKKYRKRGRVGLNIKGRDILSIA